MHNTYRVYSYVLKLFEYCFSLIGLLNQCCFVWLCRCDLRTYTKLIILVEQMLLYSEHFTILPSAYTRGFAN